MLKDVSLIRSRFSRPEPLVTPSHRTEEPNFGVVIGASDSEKAGSSTQSSTVTSVEEITSNCDK